MKINRMAKVKFISNNLTGYLNDRKQFVKLARATFGYADSTVSEDILLSLDKAWKEYLEYGKD